jgi:hypothetical protein
VSQTCAVIKIDRKFIYTRDRYAETISPQHLRPDVIQRRKDERIGHCQGTWIEESILSRQQSQSQQQSNGIIIRMKKADVKGKAKVSEVARSLAMEAYRLALKI